MSDSIISADSFSLSFTLNGHSYEWTGNVDDPLLTEAAIAGFGQWLKNAAKSTDSAEKQHQSIRARLAQIQAGEFEPGKVGRKPKRTIEQTAFNNVYAAFKKKIGGSIAGFRLTDWRKKNKDRDFTRDEVFTLGFEIFRDKAYTLIRHQNPSFSAAEVASAFSVSCEKSEDIPGTIRNKIKDYINKEIEAETERRNQTKTPVVENLDLVL